MREIDYSDKAISMRITRMAQLRNLCVSLARAGKAARESQKQVNVTPSTSRAASDR